MVGIPKERRMKRPKKARRPRGAKKPAAKATPEKTVDAYRLYSLSLLTYSKRATVAALLQPHL